MSWLVNENTNQIETRISEVVSAHWGITPQGVRVDRHDGYEISVSVLHLENQVRWKWSFVQDPQDPEGFPGTEEILQRACIYFTQKVLEAHLGRQERLFRALLNPIGVVGMDGFEETPCDLFDFGPGKV